ncbi:hypothetical protein EX30DRAFT_360756 [Ascodesmis nigricans]|uniref:Uncharacterized protein n=1 Tax=Ascodesmis nigricans TaxID=341454 RepID=A0A4S2N620_9PEZI|nr:hypothetical protein EX30DRAFT_360756 [Ascodesmis nigricans]
MGWWFPFSLPFKRSGSVDASSLNNIYNSDMTITCDDIIFYGHLSVMNQYTQYFSDNLAAMKHKARKSGDWEDVEDDGSEATRILKETKRRGANFDLSAFRPFIVYTVLVWCHKKEYPLRETEEMFLDRKHDLIPLINHIRTHHLARHLALQPLIDLTLQHIVSTLSAPMPLMDFLHSIPIAYSPPTDLATCRTDPVKAAIVERTVADIEELAEVRQWVGMLQVNAGFASEVALRMVGEKRGERMRRIGYCDGGKRRWGAGWMLKLVGWVVLVGVVLVGWRGMGGLGQVKVMERVGMGQRTVEGLVRAEWEKWLRYESVGRFVDTANSILPQLPELLSKVYAKIKPGLDKIRQAGDYEWGYESWGEGENEYDW